MNKEELEQNIETKYISIKQALVKSRTVLCAYLAGATSYLSTNGSELLKQLSDSLPQLQSVLDVKVFGWVSFIATIGTIYFKIKSTSIVGKKDESTTNN